MKITINGRFVAQRATGVQRVAREVVRAIDRLVGAGRWAGVEIRVAVPETPDAAHLKLGLLHLPIDVVPGGSGQLWEQNQLMRAAEGSVLVCLGNTAPLLPLLAGRPMAVMIHDLAYRLFPNDYSVAYRLAHRVLDAVILRRARPLMTVSQTERGTLQKVAGPGRRIVVASNGSVPDDVVPEVVERSAGGPLLYVGAFSARKNIDSVFEIAIAVAAYRGVGTVLVGPPNDVSAELESRVPPQLRHLVRFAGFVDDAELATLYRTASALLYPSLYEASGLPPSEAMSYGLPVIASDLPVLRERCGEAALFCDPHDRELLIATALRVVDDADLRSRLSAAGRTQAATFTWAAQAETIVESVLQAA